ncbi:MAG: xylulokinase [Bdellovibrionota bacterium]
MSAPYFLTLDLGTSGPKVALFTAAGELVASEFTESRLILSAGGGAEQDPEEWWSGIRDCTRKILASGRVRPEEIVAINCTTQWSGTVAVDAGGRALMNAIIWMDSRGKDFAREITDGLVKIEGYGASKLFRWLRLTGGIPTRSGKDSIAHILYIQKKLPEIYKRTHKFLEPKDYLNLRLTGRMTASYDSIALHWVTDNRDIANVHYDPGLIAMTGVDAEKFPELVPAASRLGTLTPEAARELGLPASVQVISGTPDIQSAAVGSGAVRDFEAHLYIGTSSWLTCHVPYKKTDVFHNMTTLPSGIPGRYFIANEQETAGACLTFLRDQVFFNKDALTPSGAPKGAYALFDQLAAEVPPGSGGVIFTPWLNGERTPVENHAVRASFFNLSLSTSRAQMVRAVLEGVALNSRWLLGTVEKFIGRKLPTIKIIGGGAKSDLWCQIFADVLEREIWQVEDPIHAGARGAAMLAAAALGYCQFEEIADRVRIRGKFTPEPAHRDVYVRQFSKFRRLYKHSAEVHP